MMASIQQVVFPFIVCLLHGFLICQGAITGGMLYAKESESREVKELNGLWNFRADKSSARDEGFTQKWFMQSLAKTGAVIDMPVPCSYNDVTQDRTLRDFVGWAWYDKEFIAPNSWGSTLNRVFLRFESAHYNTVVWVNSKQVVTHEGGHLPFEAEVTSLLNYGQENRITVAVNNTLTPDTLPPGTVTHKSDTKRYPPGYYVQNLQMDFFNYAGIQRPVKLYTTPLVYIDDITINTTISGSTGIIDFSIAHISGAVNVTVELFDAANQLIAKYSGTKGKLTVKNAKFWWPYTMSDTPAYLYKMKVNVSSSGVHDIYRLPVGIRTVKTTDKQFLINGQPFYLHGVNKHEDADIRGKGLDLPLVIKDFSLLKWLGANGFRTSHYPYAEEIMDLCDKLGIVVIDESPGVGIKTLENFDNTSLAHHIEVMTEMWRRDKNRPSVVMWSVANEPNSKASVAGPYFKSVIGHVRSLDSTRPVTFVVGGGSQPTTDHAAQYVDVLCINTYYAWYSDPGHLEVITLQANNDLVEWHKEFNKPVIQSEYGADTIPGFHVDPPLMFTEEYQVEFLKNYHAAFDQLRKDFFVGELIWNFADFMTDQSVTRAVGNKKGVFTRQRQPKASAHLLRQRYQSLINDTLTNCNKHNNIVKSNTIL
ncbi:beta-glucuronidase-like isoform X2 [Amphiura filiformis]|uniref:beta-glucuronidase-like isoform X2 n=1 Tax=Amphiura filiformis TaxID=82378 RepID=UPI003B20D132